MDSYRKTAVIVGVLFIAATVAGMVGAVLYGPILDDEDYLVNTSTNENEVISGSLSILIMGAAIAGTGVMMFPILKKVNEGLALGYAAFRILGFVICIISVMSVLSLLTLSQEYVNAEAPDVTSYETQGAILQAQYDWGHIPADIVFGLDCLMIYSLLFVSRLVPRLLSTWGLIGGILVLVAAVLGAFKVIGAFDTSSILLNLPIAVLEMVFAGWLIVKGFNLSAIASLSAKASEGRD